MGGFVGGDSSQKPKTTALQTLMHILKGNIGGIVLSVPAAFKHSGLLVGSICLPIVALICIHCQHILLNCNAIVKRQLKRDECQYEKVFENAVELGPQRLRPYGFVARKLVTAFLIVTQLGFCSVYVVFIPENIKAVVYHLTDKQFDLNIRYYQLMILPILLALTYIKHLRTLALGSLAANLIIGAGFIIIFQGLFQEIPPVADRKLFAPITELPLFLGTVVYTFEGIGLVLPVQKAMKKPEKFSGPFGVLNQGMLLVLTVVMITGIMGFIKFGELAEGTITLNFPPTPLYQTCRLMFALATFCSYPILIYVPIEIIWPWCEQKFNLSGADRRTMVYDYGMRTILVLITFVFAAAIPDLSLYISLLGALTTTSLALIFPPVIEMFAYWSEPKGALYGAFIYTKDILIAALGVFCLITGTYASVMDLVTHFKDM